MSSNQIGQRHRDGTYDVTFRLDADDLDSMACEFGPRDTFADELFALASEIREREAARDEGPWLRIVVSAVRRG